jgi:hypothetical protein
LLSVAQYKSFHRCATTFVAPYFIFQSCVTTIVARYFVAPHFATKYFATFIFFNVPMQLQLKACGMAFHAKHDTRCRPILNFLDSNLALLRSNWPTSLAVAAV